MTAVGIDTLELPELNTIGMEREHALEVTTALAKETWIAKTDLGYAVLRHEDVVAILRDRRFFNAIRLLPQLSGVDPEVFDVRRRESILSMEGEDHTRLRRLVSPAFSPAATEPHRPFMAQLVAELVDPYLASGEVELVSAVCEPYPIPIICEVLGAPREHWRQFSDWATDIFKIFNGDLAKDFAAIRAAQDGLGAYIAELVDERRSAPRNDLLSHLIAAEEEGDRLSTDELCMLAEAVLMAGTDTTRNQLGCTMAMLAQHPDQWALLQADPTLASRAVEESMRYLGAVRGVMRYASEDITYRDVVFPKGTIVGAQLGSANRDPGVFSAPERIDLLAERTVEHVTFGSGIHRCLGAALARAELQEALVVLAERMDNLSLGGPITWKPSSFGIWGPAELPLRFTPRR